MTALDIIDGEVVEDEPIFIEPESLTPRQQHVAELRKLLDLLEARPDLPLPYYWGTSQWDEVWFAPANAREAANLVKAIGGKWDKNDPKKSEHDAATLKMHTVLDREVHVKVTVSREGVCEKKVVGTTKKKVEKVVVAQVTEEVYEDVDVVEFECKSLMSLADQEIMADLEAIAS